MAFETIYTVCCHIILIIYTCTVCTVYGNGSGVYLVIVHVYTVCYNVRTA